jgi:hypothetical protein
MVIYRTKETGSFTSVAKPAAFDFRCGNQRRAAAYLMLNAALTTSFKLHRRTIKLFPIFPLSLIATTASGAWDNG